MIDESDERSKEFKEVKMEVSSEELKQIKELNPDIKYYTFPITETFTESLILQHCKEWRGPNSGDLI